MIKYDKNKFLVINRDRFEELYKAMIEKGIDQTVFYDLAAALQKFMSAYSELVPGHKLDHHYYVVNSDEPYAEAVWNLIEEGKRPLPVEKRHYRQDLLNLLAVIHRDGGHHTAKVGVSPSVVDAIGVVSDLRTATRT